MDAYAYWHYKVCDCCGLYSPGGKSKDEVEKFYLIAGWEHRKVGDQWLDICPECQSKGGINEYRNMS